MVNRECCPCCGQTTFDRVRVLWPELIEAWGLTGPEAEAIDLQQGHLCTTCNSNLRSRALAAALLREVGDVGPLTHAVRRAPLAGRSILEINEAGALSPILSAVEGHRLVEYPAVDMLDLPFPSGAYDLVVHSDTLEHVPRPADALEETRRVLGEGGATLFTVPTLPARLTRSRDGLPAVYHGAPDCTDEGFRVRTEFGADTWTLLCDAGFRECAVYPYRDLGCFVWIGRT